MSFVRRLADDPENQRLVKSIVAIAKEFGLTTVAEGVERSTTLALLEAYGVDLAQGYLFERPAPLVF